MDPNPEENKGAILRLSVKIANNFNDKTSTIDAKKAINNTKNIGDILAKNKYITDNKDKQEIARRDSFKLEARAIIIKEMKFNKNPETGLIEGFNIINYMKKEGIVG